MWTRPFDVTLPRALPATNEAAGSGRCPHASHFLGEKKQKTGARIQNIPSRQRAKSEPRPSTFVLWPLPKHPHRLTSKPQISPLGFAARARRHRRGTRAGIISPGFGAQLGHWEINNAWGAAQNELGLSPLVAAPWVKAPSHLLPPRVLDSAIRPQSRVSSLVIYLTKSF